MSNGKYFIAILFASVSLVCFCAGFYVMGFQDGKAKNLEKIGDAWDDGHKWGEMIGEMRGYRKAKEEQEFRVFLDSLSRCNGKEYVLVTVDSFLNRRIIEK